MVGDMTGKWATFATSYNSKCEVCGKKLDEGKTVYGTKSPDFVKKKGKSWFIVCPECHANGVEPTKTADAVKSIYEGMEIPPEVSGVVAARETFDEYIASLDSSYVPENEFSAATEEGKYIKKSAPEKDSNPKAPVEKKAWSMGWIRENAVWGI